MTAPHFFAPMGGLGNRLATILSYRAKYGKLDVVWSHAFQVGGGSWAETFEPLEGVTFAESDAIIHHEGGPKVVGNVTYDNHACCALDPQWYRELRLVPAAWERVYKHHLDVAIHVRRTDFADLKIAETTDAAFEAFIMARTNERGRVYIATDNYTTQRQYWDACTSMRRTPKVQALIPQHAELAHDHRATGMTFAAVDMFSCANADKFMGTAGSSFSRTIEILRSLRK
jgi:hypothetical protein